MTSEPSPFWIYKTRESPAWNISLPVPSSPSTTSSNTSSFQTHSSKLTTLHTTPIKQSQFHFTSQTSKMAIYTTFNNERPMLFGRSGYNNKPNGGDDEEKNQGRSGYNSKPNGGDDDDDKNHGRSGYNSKPDGSDDTEEKKRTLNFA
ncbi:hypothetical protein N0V93_006699 [Gnomoniopsis smithogilvyi]|uniref:Uncharacterized protein n=1 Tax=Gnomoniopsis smithogilvyi TaxID=1191159 RepID=A0A9W8YSE1_9PEZI|nr:hypothetical protein N0V93_006699 [Gnomoniopsis smithogilvyi]